MKIIEINNCRECPYSNLLIDMSGYYCSQLQQTIKNESKISKFCPLEDFNDRYWEGYDRCCTVNNLPKIKH
jgi:hypothetical protein